MTHFWIPKIQLLENSREIVTPSAGTSGHFSIIGTLPDGRSRVIADWQPNLITDAGLERWGTGAPVANCSVGSGNTPPTVNDTGLVEFIAQQSSVPSVTEGAQASAPYYGWARWTFRFNPPGANHNLSEVGFGWGANGSNLWSRALIKNNEGVPVTVTWLGSETLDVVYEARKYPWLGDVPYETTISGQTYSGVIRCSRVTYTGPANSYLGGWEFERTYAQSLGLYNSSPSYSFVTVYNGTIGAITSSPSGSSGYNTYALATFDPYAAHSRKRTGKAVFSASTANLSGGITAIQHRNSVGTYQMSVSPAIPKVADFTLTLNLESPTWGRYSG